MLTPEQFIKYWKVYFKENKWEDYYKNNDSWTQFILGSKSNKSKEGKFPQFLVEQLNRKDNQKTYRHRKEDGLFDLALSSHENFKGIKDFHTDPGEISFQNKNGEKLFYPTQYDLLLEHENNILLCYEEMAKLTYARAKLKVLVTYDWDEEEWKKDGKPSDSLERLIHNFSTIIRQANEGFSENAFTRYLLLLGRKSGNEMQWKHQVFDSTGTRICAES